MSDAKLPANISYPRCVECNERRGVIQIRMRKSKCSDPYCAKCAKPLINAPRSKIGAIGAVQPPEATQ